MSNSSTEKRLRTLTLCVVSVNAQTSWRDAALIFEDQSGDMAPRKVILKIEHPGDIAYIRENLDNIEAAWRKALDSIKAAT